MRELDAGEITLLLDTAASLQEIASRDIKKVPTLRGKTVINLFYEASTRTRTSFEIAGEVALGRRHQHLGERVEREQGRDASSTPPRTSRR